MPAPAPFSVGRFSPRPIYQSRLENVPQRNDGEDVSLLSDSTFLPPTPPSTKQNIKDPLPTLPSPVPSATQEAKPTSVPPTTTKQPRGRPLGSKNQPKMDIVPRDKNSLRPRDLGNGVVETAKSKSKSEKTSVGHVKQGSGRPTKNSGRGSGISIISQNAVIHKVKKRGRPKGSKSARKGNAARSKEGAT
ncbi:MAG: hypothetical protein Q9180_007672 [Flavoplaca navasiana]